MIVEFPSVEQTKRWYDSNEDRPLKEMRMNASDVEGILVQGLTPAPPNAT